MLEQAVALLELSDLGFFGERQAVAHAFFDLGSLQPPLDTRATATTSRQNSAGNAFGIALLLPVMVTITAQESTEVGAIPVTISVVRSFQSHALLRTRGAGIKQAT